jgi:hypothetical protein
MSKENKTKEEILDKSLDEMGEEYFPVFELSVHKEAVLNAMSEYAKIKSRERAIAFFKWYALKMVGFIEYIKDIRPVVTSNEIEEKIAEFEGQTIDNLFNLFLQQTEGK